MPTARQRASPGGGRYRTRAPGPSTRRATERGSDARRTRREKIRSRPATGQVQCPATNHSYVKYSRFPVPGSRLFHRKDAITEPVRELVRQLRMRLKHFRAVTRAEQFLMNFLFDLERPHELVGGRGAVRVVAPGRGHPYALVREHVICRISGFDAVVRLTRAQKHRGGNLRLFGQKLEREIRADGRAGDRDPVTIDSP